MNSTDHSNRTIQRLQLAVPLPPSADSEFLYLPSGIHKAVPVDSRSGESVAVMINEAAAAQLENERASFSASGREPYFDFNLSDRGAAFWPEKFFWRNTPSPGVYCRGEWTDDGTNTVNSSDPRWLCPVFHVEESRAVGTPHQIISNQSASPVMGGIMKSANPTRILPITAKEQEHTKPDTKTDMNTSELIDRSVREHLSGGALIRITGQSPKDSIKAYGAILAKNAKLPLNDKTCEEKGKLALDAAAIFSADLSKLPKGDLYGAIMAADVTSDNLGILSGAVAMQSSLPALMRENPLLNSVTSDLSAEPGKFKGTDTTRIVLRPTVQEYDDTAGTDGRPKGWTIASEGRTIDVPVTLDKYYSVPIVFGVTTLASTGRRLFDEQAPQAIQAMGDYAVNQLSALITAGNFNAFKGTSLAAGATTDGSKTVTVTSTANAWKGAEISGTGIPTGATVAAVVDGTTLTLSKAATATNTGLTLTLSGQGATPNAYTTYARAFADFGVADLDLLAAAFDSNNVPMRERFAVLSPSYYRKLGSDSQVNALMQGTGNAAFLTERKLPMISNFELLNSPWMPSSSYRVGFAAHKAALVLKTRLPMDLQNALPNTPMPGSVATITDPATGLSLALVSHYNMQGGYAEWRPEMMAGFAVGDRRAGLVLTSQ